MEKRKGADTFPFAFTGSLRMKTRQSCRNGCPHHIGMNIDQIHDCTGKPPLIIYITQGNIQRGLHRKQHSDYSFCGKIVLTEGNKAGFNYRGASYLMQRNQFLRLFLCEREIIVNALFLLICLGSGKAKSMCKDTNNNLNNAQISNYFFKIRKQQGQRKGHDDANDELQR